MDFKAKALEVQDFVVDFRRDLHRHPEASMQEFRTTDKICEALDAMGIPYRRTEPTGCIAEIKGGKPGKTIALRADIDALSITEKTGLPFASEVDGMMHACGHDTHAAMLIGAAKVLNSMKDELCGNVRLLFQPAEEIAEGAKVIVANGGAEGVDRVFAIHIAAQAPAGSVVMCPGGTCAAADIFKIKVVGKACHGAAPDTGIDATVAAAAIVMNLQTIVSREISPNQPLVVTVGQLHSGSRFNIVSGEANMDGTVRSFDVNVHHAIPGIMERIVKSTAAAYRCEAEVEYDMKTEVVVNDDKVYADVWNAALKVTGDPAMVNSMVPWMAAEDFCEYTTRVPGCFAMLGAGGEHPLHSDYCTFDEDAFSTGVALHCQVAYDFLNGAE